MSGDSLLFKYRAIGPRLTDSIVNGTWYFAKPDTLNDPFDCRVDIRKALSRAASNTSRLRAKFLEAALKRDDGMLDTWVQQFADFGVFSLSQTSVSELLWAHYADNHRGVVLTYQFDEQFISDPQNKFVCFDYVKYGQNAVTNYIQNATLNHENPDSFINELAKLYLTAKAEAWRYEEEVRIIRTISGPMKTPKGTLRGIIFGLRTAQADVERITALAKQHTDCGAFAQMQSDDSDFGFAAKRI